MTKKERQLKSLESNGFFKSSVGIFNLASREEKSLPRFTPINEVSVLVEESDGGIPIQLATDHNDHALEYH